MSALIAVAPPTAAIAGDTQGIVSSVVTLPVASGKHRVRVYFSSFTSDRWGCLSGLGYIEANDMTEFVDAKTLDRFFAMATVALTSGATLSIDSPGTNPCTDANYFALAAS